jgi:hypothetical protein
MAASPRHNCHVEFGIVPEAAKEIRVLTAKISLPAGLLQV